MILRLLLVVFGLLFATASNAQAPGLPDVLLTPERVESVVTAFPLMRERLKAMDARFDSKGKAGDVASGLQALAMLGSAQSALNGAAADLGFADFMDWLSATNAVFMAHAFARNPALDSQIQQALDQIDKQPGLSKAQKDQMRAAIMQSVGALQSMKPPEQNLAAVAPYHDRIEAILEE